MKLRLRLIDADIQSLGWTPPPQDMHRTEGEAAFKAAKAKYRKETQVPLQQTFSRAVGTYYRDEFLKEFVKGNAVRRWESACESLRQLFGHAPQNQGRQERGETEIPWSKLFVYFSRKAARPVFPSPSEGYFLAKCAVMKLIIKTAIQNQTTQAQFPVSSKVMSRLDAALMVFVKSYETWFKISDSPRPLWMGGKLRESLHPFAPSDHDCHLLGSEFARVWIIANEILGEIWKP